MNFTARLVLLGLFGFAFVNQAFAQRPKVDSYEWTAAAPSLVRMYACDFFLDDRVVTVTLDDQSVLSGKIERIDSEEFSLLRVSGFVLANPEEEKSGPVGIRFDRVRSLSAPKQKPSPALRAREQAQRFHTDKPKYIYRVTLRQNGGTSAPAAANPPASTAPPAPVELLGHISRADELKFVLKDKDSGDERELDYRDVQGISPTFEESVVDGLNKVGLVLLLILLTPLVMLTGMDC